MVFPPRENKKAKIFQIYLDKQKYLCYATHKGGCL
nr:MAG TPA: hypothetical protein [Caudoviricetes sp.]